MLKIIVVSEKTSLSAVPSPLHMHLLGGYRHKGAIRQHGEGGFVSCSQALCDGEGKSIHSDGINEFLLKCHWV